MGKLDGKAALVTGASKGIGRGICRALAAEGCALMMTARGDAELLAAAHEMEQLGVTTITAAGDVADERHVERTFALAARRLGRLDLLVNNAGAFDGGPLDELAVEDWDRVIATNLRGPFLCTRAAMRIMKRQGVGRIINVGSIAAQRVRPHSAPYSASKHGLWGLTQVTALEGRDHGITCGCLHPGNIQVERRVDSGQREDEEPMIGVEQIAEVALLMATLPPEVELLEAIVLPHRQSYVGRG